MMPGYEDSGIAGYEDMRMSGWTGVGARIENRECFFPLEGESV